MKVSRTRKFVRGTDRICFFNSQCRQNVLLLTVNVIFVKFKDGVILRGNQVVFIGFLLSRGSCNGDRLDRQCLIRDFFGSVITQQARLDDEMDLPINSQNSC